MSAGREFQVDGAATEKARWASSVCMRGTTKLSYRKQIARKLPTQYVEGIKACSNSVTLKSRLEITQVIESGTVR